MIRLLLIIALFCPMPSLAAPGTNVKAGRAIQGTAAKPCRSDQVYKWLDGMRGDASRMSVDGCDIRVSFRGVELTRKATPIMPVADGVTIRNSSFTLIKPTSPTAIPTGIQCKWGTRTLIDNVTVRGFKAERAEGVYANGDGLGSEFCVGLTYRNVTSVDNGNGGFDDKARNVLYDNTVSIGNDYGYRMWWRGPGNFVGTTMTCQDNHISCLHLMNGGKRASEIGNAEPVIDHLIVHFSKGAAITPILMAEAGTAVTIKRCTITADEVPSAPVAFGGTKATRMLGKSCMDEAGNIIWSKASKVVKAVTSAT